MGVPRNGTKANLITVLIPLLVCYLPLVIITLINGTFWTGDRITSFITHFDTQTRFLITMPILLLAEKGVSRRLNRLLMQFFDSGIVSNSEAIRAIVKRNVRFLRSNWTILGIYALCYLQVIIVLFYESENTSMLSWQIKSNQGEPALNLVGKWSILISRPFILFLFYRWLVRIAIWGNILHKISRLELNLFAVHPDGAGGLGFLGYAIRFFSPIAFAISATVAGYMADFMLIEGIHLDNLKLPGIAYLLFITLLFTVPLLSFVKQLIRAREIGIFENYDFANGIFRELRTKFAKGYYKVNEEDLNSPAFSAAGDLSAVMDNALKMRYLPFTLKDLIPLWVMAALPFLGVVLLEIPISELLQKLATFLV